jgi:hypothetical protein
MAIYEVIGAGVVVLFNLYLFIRQRMIISNLKKSEYIHQLQFQREFELYKEIWDILIDIKRIVFRLGSPGENIEEGKTFQQMKEEVIELAGNEGQKLIDITYKNEPFFHPDVFKSLDEITKIFQLSRIRAKYFYEDKKRNYIPADYEAKFWSDAVEALTKYELLMDGVCKEIRERIGVISSGASSFQFV